MTADIVVAIPVYNAFQEALECLQSVLQHSRQAKQILVIDDASPEGNFCEYVANKLPSDVRLVIERNDQNLGFVGTCNRIFEETGMSDVLLLNSDTLVTSNWLGKLQAAAYSSVDVGTVTALSNNAVICSVPRFCLENSIPADMTLEGFAELVERVSERDYNELPTCMGFCVYIKRAALDSVGFFDLASFGKGYGEENDFSQRVVDAGLKNICDDASYVYHKGNCSFLGAQKQLEKDNWATLTKKHPHFADLISKFCRENPLRPVQRRIQKELLLRKGDLPRVLHILHNGPQSEWHGPLGGTELHVMDLISNAEQFAHYSLVRAGSVYYLSAHVKGAEREFILEVEASALSELLRPDLFDIVHFHHARWFEASELKAAILGHGNFVVSVHDYSLICPQFFLYTAKKNACTGFECQSECGYSAAVMEKLRSESLALINSAKQVFCFSDSTRENFARIVADQGNWLKVHHGLRWDAGQAASSAELVKKGGQESFKIALLGYIPDHKGARLIGELQKMTKLAGKNLEWHVFGKLFNKSALNIVDHGEYKRAELVGLLKAERPDLVMILSECPETYSLTLDEAWAAGIPVLSTPLGAPAERVKATGAGWLLDNLNHTSVLAGLSEIISDRADYLKKVENAAAVNLISVAQESEKYAECYARLGTSSDRIKLSDLLNHFEQIELDRPPPVKGVWRWLGRGANLGIYVLDSLGIRWFLQNAAYRLLPGRVLDRVKAAR